MRGGDIGEGKGGCSRVKNGVGLKRGREEGEVRV